MRNFIFLVAILSISFCKDTPQGTFGWNVQEISEDKFKVKNFLSNRHYVITDENKIFKQNSVISYLYQFETLPSKKQIEVSLEKKTLDYIEISTSTKTINQENQIWGIYKNLEAGKYRIRLSTESQVFDSALFKIME